LQKARLRIFLSGFFETELDEKIQSG